LAWFRFGRGNDALHRHRFGIRRLNEVVIFDCDGVLVNSEVLALEVELAATAHVGLHYGLDEFKTRFMGRTTDAFFELLAEDYRALTGSDLPPDFRDSCYGAYRASLHRLTEVDGAFAMASAITRRKAVASSSTADALEEKLRRTNLWDHFAPHVYSTDLVAHGKPAPDIFLHAAKMLKADPRDCLVIEDSVNGVTAALAAGMRVWGFTGGGHMDERAGQRLRNAGAEHILTHWSEALALLAG
jgi:beta-phosphoglucomutase-like phosphatase (HAD superfamily)